MPKIGRVSLPLSNYQQFLRLVKEWDGCQRCELHRLRCHLVHYRGGIPCDVLYVGEAPGESEDARGIPFDGPAGQLLDQIDAAVFPGDDPTIRGFCNLVACWPKAQKKTPDHRPPHESVMECRPRLEQIIRLADPKLVVCVGAMAGDYLRQGYKDSVRFHKPMHTTEIMHPAAIKRMPYAQQGMAADKQVIVLRDAVETMLRPLPEQQSWRTKVDSYEDDIPF
jgi:DNA polymerase